MKTTFLLSPLLLSGLLLGCNDAALKKCHTEMELSQKELLSMDKHDLTSVEKTLGGIRRALTTCKEARRRDEVADLEEAERNVTSHVELLKKRAARGARKLPSPEELAKLRKDGDPECPRGHVYSSDASQPEIRCVGPQIAEMTFAQARKYFDMRGYKVTSDGKPPVLRAEYGAQLYEFRFATADDTAKATCLSVVSPPNVPWKETVARITGVRPEHVEDGKPLPLASGALPFRLEGEGEVRTVRVGGCADVGSLAAPGAAAPSAPAPSAPVAPQKSAP